MFHLKPKPRPPAPPAPGTPGHAGDSPRALAEGAQGGRPFYDAAVVESAAGEPEEARKYFAKAGALAQMLMPSERQTLQRKLATLPPAGVTHFSSN